MSNFFLNRINTNLDNYYNEPYNYKFGKNNFSNIIMNTDNDLNVIIQSLTSIIMSNKSDNNSNNVKFNFFNDSNINLTSIMSSVENNFNDVNLNKHKNNDHNLFKLIANNNINQLNLILQNNKLNININIQDEDGDTPLHMSVFLYNYEMCNILLSNGANPYIKDKWGQISIHRLCFCSGEIDAIKIIDLFNNYQKKISAKLNIFNYIDNNGNTPLHLVLNYFIKNKTILKNNHLKIINKLKRLTDIELINKKNQSIEDLLKIFDV